MKFMEFLQEERVLNEAFSDSSMNKAMQLITISIEKRLDSTKLPISRVPGTERYKSSAVSNGYGIRFFCNDFSCFRINFKKKAKASEIVSIDIWDGKKRAKLNANGDAVLTPTVNINTKNASIVKIIPFIASQINNPKTGKFAIMAESFEDEEELLTNEWLSEAKFTYSYEGNTYKSKSSLEAVLRSKGIQRKEFAKILEQHCEVSGGSPEIDNTDVAKTEHAIEQVVIDPNELLDEHIPEFTEAVANGISHALVIYGQAGIGKCLALNTEFNIITA